MRTKGIIQCDNPNPYPDGVITLGPTAFTEAISVPVGALAVSTDLVSYQVPANKTIKLFAFFNPLLRTGMSDDMQQQFGNASGGAMVTDGTPSGRVPFTGATQLTPQSSSVARKKGFKPWNISLAHKITANDLTTFNIKVIARKFVHGDAAPTDTVLVDVAPSKVKSATIKLVSVASPYFTSQDYIITSNTLIQVIIDGVTNAGGGTFFDIFSLSMYGTYNYL